MMKTIWCFGDSWTWGSELWDISICEEFDARKKYGVDFSVTCEKNHEYVYRNRWSGLLSKYDYDVTNFSESGASNAAMLETMVHAKNTLTTTPDYIIIAWTSQSREAKRKEDWSKIDNPSYRFIAETSTLTDDEQSVEFYKQVMTANHLFLDSIVINIDAFYKNKTYYPLPESIEYMDETLLGIATNYKFPEITSLTKELHWEFGSKGMTFENLKPNGHPDEVGHKLISEYFLKELKAYENR